MPRGGKCDHKNCDGLDCKQLTPEELEPAEKDVGKAQRLLDGGWISVSSRHRRLARATDKFLTADQLIKPKLQNTMQGGQLAMLWQSHRLHAIHHYASQDPSNNKWEGLIEEQTLTLREFRAFKKLGGASA